MPEAAPFPLSSCLLPLLRPHPNPNPTPMTHVDG
ncbi:hypothetical protein RRG08_034948 [Elysia crispata]|uniref:Uncharacterized protein n=1 Tax=Elysia crispata TaxID=231223 RepID=A0AAE0Y3H3_9GAST|nr:hypothetical protein RRG08_034948 [Elysia crispata]